MSGISITKKSYNIADSAAKLLIDRYINVPADAVSFDYLMGSNKNGRYRIFSFRNKEGVVIQNHRTHINKHELKDVITDIQRNIITNITRRTIINGQEISNENQSFLPLDNPNLSMFIKSFLNLTPHGDSGGFDLLQKGTKPSSVKFNYNWHGPTTDIEYKNCSGHTLDLTETECQYLPFIPRKYILAIQNKQIPFDTCDFTTERIDAKINLAQRIQEKFHGIEGILPPARGTKIEELGTITASGKTCEQWQQEKGCIPTAEITEYGWIKIATNLPGSTDGLQILKSMAHEIQHATDLIEAYRGGFEAFREGIATSLSAIQNSRTYLSKHINKIMSLWLDDTGFIDRIIRIKGQVKKGTEEYKNAVKRWQEQFYSISNQEYTSQEEHDAQIPEQRANDKSEQEIELVDTISEKILNFMHQFVKKT